MRGVVSFLACLIAGASVASAGTLPPGFIEQDIGGTWDEAVAVHFGPGNRMYVVERKGKVWIVENGVRLPQPFIDLRDEVGGWRDYGLLGFALHPNFAANGYVYLLYVVDTHHLLTDGEPGNGYDPARDQYYDATIGRITRYTADPTNDRKTVLAASRFVLLGETASTGFPILHQSHGTGALVFGMDGTLLGLSGDGACYSHTDQGSDSDTYFQHGLDYGIIGPDQNVGGLRSQYLGSLSGKMVRLDPETGDGLPGNPFFDPANPRSARSRTWALGLRNPYRFSLKPGSGSHNAADANPGTFFVGDVGWGSAEDFHVVDRPGLNLGWPIFEGMGTRYLGSVANLQARNPLYGAPGCTQQFFNFVDLIKQESNNPVSFPNPCNPSVPIPDSWTDGGGQTWRYFKFEHTRPPIAWRGSAVAATFDAAGAATTCPVGANGCKVQGAQFSGNASTGGVFYTGDDFPAEYKNTYFHADFGGQWIRNFKLDGAGEWNRVDGFLTQEPVVFVTTHPTDGGLYYVRWGNKVRRIVHAPGGNQPPLAVATPAVSFGPAPLTVEFASASTDPEGLPLQHRWSFGDGGPDSDQAAPPPHVFTAADSRPGRFDVKLRVTDPGGAIGEKETLVSVNNTPPAVEITSPLPGTLYSMTGDEVHMLSADISDLEHGPSELSCAWQFTLHHNEHTHAEPVNASCSALAPTSPVGCDGNTYFFRATLTVTDAHGLATTRAVDLLPNCVNAQADLAVSVSGAPDAVVVGSSITYGITVANTGTNNVEGVTLTDTLAPGTSLLSAPGHCTPAAGKVICSLGAFGVGQSESLTLVVRANVPGTLLSTVEVTSLTAESNAANNLARASTQVAGDQPPTASPQAASLAEDAALALTLTGSDPEGGALTFQIASGPAHGSLAGTGASRTYTPAADYHGPDGFTFTVHDPSGNSSAPAAVSISVSPVNDPPLAIPQALALAEDTSLPLTLAGSDVDGDPLIFSLVSGPANGALAGAPPNLTYVPRPDFFGADSFVFRVSDGQAAGQGTVSLSISDEPEPLGWTSGDVGAPGLAGRFAWNGGTFTVEGGGADIWDLSDQFHFVRQPLAGDATIVARVVSLTNTNPWAKAGVMIRESLLAGSRHVMVVNTPGNGTALQRRLETGQASAHTAGVKPGFPYWVRLTRSGNVFTGFTSPDGTAWSSLGSVTVNMATAYVGLGVTAHDNAQRATAVIDNVTLALGAVNAPPTIGDIPNQTVAMGGVLGPLAFTVGDAETAAGALTVTGTSSDTTLVPSSGIAFGGSGTNRTVTVTPAAGRTGAASITVGVSDGALGASDTFVVTVVGGGALPSPWASQDIGSPGLAGSASAAGGVFTVKGGGNDIWGASDKFHFAWQTMVGDGEIRARVSGVQNTNPWAKAGVMMRQSLAGNSRHAMMVVTPGNGASFQRRPSAGGASQHTPGPPVTAPYWVRLTRVGNVFQGYASPDGVAWTSVGSVTMSLPSQVYFGLCVTAHDNTKRNTSSFDSVSATP